MRVVFGFGVSLLVITLVGCSSTLVESQPQPAMTPQARIALERGEKAIDSGDYASAKALFLPLARQGYAEAQYRLGVMYEGGKGVSRDYGQALEWYRKASARGSGKASLWIANMYLEAEGVSRSAGKWQQWSRRAADQGNTEAQVKLAGVYGVLAITHHHDSDYMIKAVKWYMIARKGGNMEGSDNFEYLKKQMTPSQISKASQLASRWWAAHHQCHAQDCK